MGGWIALTTIAFRTGGVDEASRLLVAELLPSALVALSIGMLISRGHHQGPGVAGVAEAIGFAAIAVSLAAGVTGPWLYVGAVIASVCMVAIRPSVAAALPTLVSEPSELTAANVVIGWVTAAAAMVGPLIVAATNRLRHRGSSAGRLRLGHRPPRPPSPSRCGRFDLVRVGRVRAAVGCAERVARGDRCSP